MRAVVRRYFHVTNLTLRFALSLRPLLYSTLVSLFVVSALITFARSGTQALLINDLIRGAGTGLWSPSIVLWIGLFILVRFIPDILGYLRDYLQWVMWFQIDETWNVRMLQKRAKLDVAAHEDPKIQNLLTRVGEAGSYRVSNMSERTTYILENVLEVVIAAGILISFNLPTALIILVTLVPSLLIEIKYADTIWGIDVANSELRRRYWHLKWHFTQLGSLIELKLSNLAPAFVARVTKYFKIFRGTQEETRRVKFWRSSVANIITYVGFVTGAIWAINAVLHGGMQIGTFTFFLASLADLRMGLSSLFMNLARQYADARYAEEFFEVQGLEERVKKADKPIVLAKDKTPEIRFENVSFGYPNTKSLVLKNISITIPPGEKLAIVGVNGAGKTTLIKLLSRFYDPTKGRILVDGVDLRKVDLESWYHHLGALFQDYTRYEFSVEEAIGVTRPEMKLLWEKVKKAAEDSEASTFIEEWKQQYKQQLGNQYKGGLEPSVGQWQKLALARTFYRDPRIYILDEPTASIDAEAEANIFDRLEQLPNDRTVILISHRFSTVRHATRIVVIEDGKISELGSHEQLLEQRGTYARLFHLQAKGYAS